MTRGTLMGATVGGRVWLAVQLTTALAANMAIVAAFSTASTL